jgi:hypothetical protein
VGTPCNRPLKKWCSPTQVKKNTATKPPGLPGANRLPAPARLPPKSAESLCPSCRRPAAGHFQSNGIQEDDSSILFSSTILLRKTPPQGGFFLSSERLRNAIPANAGLGEFPMSPCHHLLRSDCSSGFS